MNDLRKLITLQPPVSAPITQRFGENPEVYARFRFPGHNGLDYGCAIRTPVRAAAGATVDKVAFEEGGFGRYVKLRHVGLVYTIYAHLSEVIVEPGERVEAGEIIAYSGSTGFVTGPHLHFSVKAPGGDPAYRGYVDPEMFLPMDQDSSDQVIANGLSLGERLFQVDIAKLNLRSGPGVQFPTIGSLVQGEKVTASRLFVDTGWLDLGDGRYCALAYNGDTYMTQVEDEKGDAKPFFRQHRRTHGAAG